MRHRTEPISRCGRGLALALVLGAVAGAPGLAEPQAAQGSSAGAAANAGLLLPSFVAERELTKGTLTLVGEFYRFVEWQLHLDEDLKRDELHAFTDGIGGLDLDVKSSRQEAALLEGFKSRLKGLDPGSEVESRKPAGYWAEVALKELVQAAYAVLPSYPESGEKFSVQEYSRFPAVYSWLLRQRTHRGLGHEHVPAGARSLAAVSGQGRGGAGAEDPLESAYLRWVRGGAGARSWLASLDDPAAAVSLQAPGGNEPIALNGTGRPLGQ